MTPISYRFQTVPQLLRNQATERGSACALKTASGQQLTYTQLHERVSGLVEQLRAFGIQRHTRVGIVLPNGMDMSVVLLATTSACIAAPLNPLFKEQEFQSYFDEIEIDCIITTAADSFAKSVAKQAGMPVLELSWDGTALQASPSAPNIFSAGAPERDALSEIDPDAKALVLLTSGSTGRSKRVPLTHRNLCASAADVCRSLLLQPTDICLSMWEQFHIGGITDLLLAPLASGGQVICTSGFDAHQFFDVLTQFEPTWFQGVPTTLGELLTVATRKGPLAKSSLRFIRSVAAALPPELMKRVEDVFGVPVVQTYGMTEAAPLIASNPLPPRIRKPGSSGPSCGTEISVRRDDGSEASSNERGQIFIKGENVISGYEKGANGSETAWPDGWFNTGDIGYLDADGYLFLTGRTKQQINRGGEKISPDEVEEALLAHPDVAEAAAFSIDHSTLGEDVAAAVVLKPGKSFDPSSIRQLVAERLAHFKVPRSLVQIGSLPRTAIGKVSREALKASVASQRNDEPSESPKTSLEKILADVWKDELGVQSVGMDDDFSQLGGDSLSYTRLLLAVERLLSIELDMSELDDNLTVRRLSILIESLPGQEAIIDRIRQLDSDTEAKRSRIGELLTDATVGNLGSEQAHSARQLKDALLASPTNAEFDALLESFYTELTPNEVAALGRLALEPSDLTSRVADRLSSAQQMIRTVVEPLSARQTWHREKISDSLRLYTGQGAAKKTLIVGFAGHVFRLMLPMWTLLSHLDSNNTALLLLWDPNRNHYSGGIPGLADSFPALLDPLDKLVRGLAYERVIAFGTSAGGLPALCAGLGNGWQATVSVNPTYPLTKRHLLPLLTTLSEQKAHGPWPKMRLYYSEHNQEDLLAAVAIAKIAKAEIRPLKKQSQHSQVLWKMYEAGELSALFSEFFGGNELAGNSTAVNP